MEEFQSGIKKDIAKSVNYDVDLIRITKVLNHQPSTLNPQP